MMSEELRKVMDKVWLNFFNDYLYKKGAITAYEWNQMANKIDSLNVKKTKNN